MLIPTNESGSDHSQLDSTKKALCANDSEHFDPNRIMANGRLFGNKNQYSDLIIDYPQFLCFILDSNSLSTREPL